MANNDVTSNPPQSDHRQGDPRAPRHGRWKLPPFLIFGVVAATIEMGVVLALLYC